MKHDLKIYAKGVVCAIGLLGSGYTYAVDEGNWLVRGRIINVNPNDSSSSVSTLANSGVGVDSASTVEVDFTYMIQANIGLELILGTTKHDLVGTGSIAGLNKIGEVGVLPPTLTAQYHFSPKSSTRPYAGVGLNYTMFYSEKTSSSLQGALGNTSMSLDPSFGLSAQAGLDIDIDNDWYFNLDLKYIQISTTAELDSNGTKRSVDVDINPWVIGIGVGKSF